MTGQGLPFTGLSSPVSLQLMQAVFILQCEIADEESINDR